MRKLKPAATLRPIILFITIFFNGTSTAKANCNPDLAEKLLIPHSSLTVYTVVRNCSVTDVGVTKIYLADNVTNKKYMILELGEEADTHVLYSNDGKLIIRLPNLIDIKTKKDSVAGIPVSYEFLPSDNPEERRNYQNWLRHPNDPASQKWYKNNFLGKIQ